MPPPSSSYFEKPPSGLLAETYGVLVRVAMRDEVPCPQSDSGHPLDARFEEFAALRPAAAAEDASVPFIEREPVAAVPIRSVVGHKPRREELHEVGWFLGMPLGQVLA